MASFRGLHKVWEVVAPTIFGVKLCMHVPWPSVRRTKRLKNGDPIWLIFETTKRKRRHRWFIYSNARGWHSRYLGFFEEQHLWHVATLPGGHLNEGNKGLALCFRHLTMVYLDSLGGIWLVTEMQDVIFFGEGESRGISPKFLPGTRERAWVKENHRLKTTFGRGYVSSQEVISYSYKVQEEPYHERVPSDDRKETLA